MIGPCPLVAEEAEVLLVKTKYYHYSETYVVNQGPLSHGGSSIAFPSAYAALQDARTVIMAALNS